MVELATFAGRPLVAGVDYPSSHRDTACGVPIPPRFLATRSVRDRLFVIGIRVEGGRRFAVLSVERPQIHETSNRT